MAYFAKSLSLFFLLVLVLFSPLQIQARESKFFNKFTHISTNNKVPESEISAPTPAPAPAPAELEVSVPAPAPAPTLFYAESENGYGLYGKVGSNQFPPTKGTETSITDESDLLNEQLSAAENYETGNPNSNHNNNLYTSNNNNNDGYGNTGYTTVNYNNNGYSNNYNPLGYETEKQGMSDTRFMQNYNNEYTTTTTNNNNKYNNNVYTSNYNKNGYTGDTGYNTNYNNNGYSSNYNTNGYENEKQGMSDTRFLENGKYYYNVKNENNYPATYESDRQSGTVKNEGSYGNTQSAYEFNTMEEYENQQGYQVNPENYVP